MAFLSAAPTGEEIRTQTAESRKRREMEAMALAYSNYRQEAAQAHRNALSNRMSVFQGAQNALGAMYGHGVDTRQIGMNPMGPSMLAVGQVGGFNPRRGAPQFNNVVNANPQNAFPGGTQGLPQQGPPQPTYPGSLPPGPNLNMANVLNPPRPAQPMGLGPAPQVPQRNFNFGRRG